MKISEFTLGHLAEAVCGDYSYTPYLRGYEVVQLFNKYGFTRLMEKDFLLAGSIQKIS